MPARDAAPAAAPAQGSAGAWLGLWIAILVLGVNWPVMKTGLEHLPPFWMVALRYATSLPVIALLIAVAHGRAPRVVRADRHAILGVAGLQFIGQMGVVTVALQWAPAGATSVLIYTTPLWLALMDLTLFGVRIGPRRATATALSAAGCAAIVLGVGGTAGIGPLLLVLLASILWSASMRLIATHAWAGGVRDALFWQFALAAAVMTPLAWAVEGPPPRARSRGRGWPAFSSSARWPAASGSGCWWPRAGACPSRGWRWSARRRR